MSDDEHDDVGIRVGCDGEVELSESVATEVVKSATIWSVNNPKLTAAVAVFCYPAYARLRAAKLRKFRLMSIVGMVADYISDQVYERMRDDYGPTEDEEVEGAWSGENAEHGPN